MVSFIGGGNRKSWRKPQKSEVTDKLDHIMLYPVQNNANKLWP